MKRILLPALTGLLVFAILADRMTRTASTTLNARASASPADPGAEAQPRAAPPPAAAANVAAPVSVAGGTSTIDRLARLAVRRQLVGSAERTYLDSLIATTDSVVRRWPDRNGAPLKVALLEASATGYVPHMGALMRQAMGRWIDAGVGVTFAEVHDTAGADIVVRWIDRFDIDRAGQTDLTWDQAGRVRHATISLAMHSSAGAQLTDAALLSVAVHETGHAIGLPHSADSNDVMFPSTRTGRLSDRDVRTAQVLYQLPPGSVKDLPGP
jgi:hypothetical protein